MDERDVGWVAGLFEGEGSIVFTGKNSVAVAVFMTDEDVLQKLHVVSGAGTLRGPYSWGNRPTHKPIWKWTISKGEEADEFLRAIRPHMGQRRQARIDQALERLSNMRGREKCSQGHDNWRPNGKLGRYCLDCSNERQRLRRAYEESLLAPKLPAPPRVPPVPKERKPVEIRHGSNSAYSYHKCRCDICIAAKQAKDRRYYERNAEKVKRRAKQYYERSKALPSVVTEGDAMSGVTKCAWCGGMSTQQGFDQATCLDCGKFTAADGSKTVASSQAEEGVTVKQIEKES